MLNSVKLLIVEDNTDLRLDLRDFFDLVGYDVSIAADGSEALELLTENPVELIISDYDMPNMSGYDLLCSLREREPGSQTPFILISGGTPPIVVGDPLYRFLQKPVIIEHLMATIEQLMTLRQSGDHFLAD